MNDDYDLHPFLQKNLAHAIGPENVDRHRELSLAGFLRLGHLARIELLNQLDSALDADDGTSLRKKAQLLSLGRQLRDVHHNLRATGR